ncbi:MAG: polysaccharide deacetylase family protein, partial [Micromonosporaceae bacterium]
ATARAEIQGDITNLLAHGFPRPISFAYPYGYYGPPEEGYVRDAGYASARTTDIYTRESIPPADPYALRMIRPGFDGSDGLAALQQDVTSAEAAPGTTWLIYLMHDFYSPINDEIADFLAWLEPRAANGTVVKTMGEVLSSTPTNQPPVASAGSAQTVSAGSTVQLDGSGSSDPNGDPLTYQWTQTGGPAVTLSSGTVVAPTFTAPTSASTLTFQLVVNDGTASSSPSTVTITVNDGTSPADNVVVSFTFDDARSSQYGVLPVFGAHGMRATFYVNTGLMGTTGIMSWAQLHDIADAGHEIGGHTVHHTGLTEVDAATARAEIQGDITNLLAQGFPRPISFAYPYGYYGPAEEGYVRDAGYASA